MSLTAGQILGSYEVVAPLGAGGMGEVWRARDTRLDRRVALKLLPAAFADDPERLARFEREAKLLAALNHPNIAAIYGFEQLDGLRFLAMELAEGEDLSSRLARGPLPLDEALGVALQIGAALEDAHEHGIVHRDLKPANVRLAADGRVKVLDFGLAKAWLGEASLDSAPNLSQSPTLAHAGTQAGIILGTAAYMSPEQARGQPVDRRTDIWAFGVVLLEMLTGRNSFSETTVSDTLAAVLKSSPDLAALPADVPSHVRHVLERCLRKDMKQRARDIGDVLLDLREASTAEGVSTPGSRVPTRAAWPIAVACLLIGAIVGLAVALLARAPAAAPSRLARLEVSPPEGTRFVRGGMALSPDGSTLAFQLLDDEGRAAIWVRPLDSLEARQLPGTEGGWMPFWSPDSRELGFFSGGQLRVADIAGGTPRVLAPAGPSTDGRGGTWSPDGTTLVFAPTFLGGLMRVPAKGGEAEPATHIEPGDSIGTHRWPQFLPDGRHFVFYASAGTGTEPGEVRLGELGRTETRRLTEASSLALWAPGGSLLYARGSSLFARRFDLDRLEFAGEPNPLGIEIPTGVAVSGLRSVTLSEDGTLAYRVDPSGSTTLAWVDRQGQELGSIGETEFWQLAPRISPDGRQILVGRYSSDSLTAGNLWLLDVERGLGTPLTFDADDDQGALWSPDGRRIAIARATNDGKYALSIIEADDPGSRRQVAESQASEALSAEAWTADGRRLLCSRRTPTGTRADLVLVDVDSGEITPWNATASAEWSADISTDGRWVAYTSDLSGVAEVYVRSLDESGAARRISTSGGAHPRWSARGNELFYLARNKDLMSVPVSASGGKFTSSAPVALFPTRIDDQWRDYDVSPDGQRILLNRPTERGDNPIVVVLGFGRTLAE